ncbi:unnamed protein product [Caretta caretta]
MWKKQALTARAQMSSLSIAAVQVVAAEEEWEQGKVENAALSQAVTCLKDLVLEGSARENRVWGAYSARVATIGVKVQRGAGPYDDWDRDICMIRIPQIWAPDGQTPDTMLWQSRGWSETMGLCPQGEGQPQVPNTLWQRLS